MGNPLYRVRASGMGGSGYARPPLPDEDSKLVKNADGNEIPAVVDANGKAVIVPGVTTIVSVGGDPGALIQWSVDQVAAYAVYNVDALLSRTADQGFGFLRFYHKRKPDLTDPLRTAHKGVLDDLAELGTNMHEWTEWDLLGRPGFAPIIDSQEMQEMVDAYLNWKFAHKVKTLAVELTVYGDGYAGTLDCILEIDGVVWLLDIKTSRAVRDGHNWQLAALNEAEWYFEDGAWHNYKETFGPIERYGFLHTRPADDDGNPAYFRIEEVSKESLKIHYESFRACLTLKRNERMLKDMEANK